RYNGVICADNSVSVHHLGSDSSHIRIIMQIQDHILTGQRGYRRSHADQDMCPKSGRPPFVCPLDSDEAAAQHSQEQTQGNGKKRNIPQIVKYRQHSRSSFLFLYCLFYSSSTT